jgi:hypothetical protein
VGDVFLGREEPCGGHFVGGCFLSLKL